MPGRALTGGRTVRVSLLARAGALCARFSAPESINSSAMQQNTQDALEEELARLRRKVRDIETELLVLEGGDKRSSPRRLETVAVQFVAEIDVIDAEGVDRSDDGVQIALPRPMRFNLRMEEDEEHVSRCAELVWTRRQADGWTRMGFQFVDAHPASAF